ncbi:transglutaminase-like domain-containing protein [Ruminococcaceae bacterium OttesenSCG-928-N02]|nr:transglutaminase-like domain-containing protein [Ruminococcaceae bacterium OttesenSCG-928-N02]
MHRSKRALCLLLALVFIISMFAACGASTPSSSTPLPDSSLEEIPAPPVRDSTPVVHTPSAPGREAYGNSLVTVDASNKTNGYFMAIYTGTNHKVKLQITGPDGNTYTYNMSSFYEAFPLTAGDGNYLVAVYENVYGNNYTPIMSQYIEVALADANAPYLRPSQYVNYAVGSTTVALGQTLAEGCESDLEVVSAAYNWVIDNITYDHYKAETVQSGYLPDVDYIIEYGYGICFDYAAVLATFLRTQRIPTRLQVGYSGGIYHAWVSVYVEDIGWINGIIQFDGESWKLMDPTFADSANQEQWITDYIANTANYQIRYEY